MDLHWSEGSIIDENTPHNTQELADLVEKEVRLIADHYITSEGRCLKAVLWDVQDNFRPLRRRWLVPKDNAYLVAHGLGIADNDAFDGTPEERCTEMVRRLRSIS